MGIEGRGREEGPTDVGPLQWLFVSRLLFCTIPLPSFLQIAPSMKLVLGVGRDNRPLSQPRTRALAASILAIHVQSIANF